MVFNKKDNPISLSWEKRYSQLPAHIQRELDDLDKKESMTNELIPIKSTRKKINDGDIFIVQPRKGIYFYGKVINANIQHIDSNHMLNGANLIFIFRMKTNEIKLPEKEFDYSKLLIMPMIVDRSCWTKGYFYNVGNVPLTETEKVLDYGFYSVAFDRIYKENGQLIHHKPSILGTYGLGSYGSVAYDITQELIIDESLLTEK